MLKMSLEFLLLTSLLGGIVFILREDPIRFREVVGQIPLIDSFIPKPCREPIPYAIGSFDTRFGISEADFQIAIAEAAHAWDQASGRTLFATDPKATLKINLIYDERQAETDRLKALSDSLSKVQASQIVLSEKQLSLSARYAATKKEYEKLLGQFQSDQEKYNREVEYWNDRGGAPEDEYKDLMKEKTSLKKAYARLESKREELNEFARGLTSTSRVETKLIEGYNAEVLEYKEVYGEPEEFQEGLYTGKSIDIFQFEDHAQLILVLAHELGHALGIDHVANPTSLMYHFMAEQSDVLMLSNEDMVALKTACALP